MTSKSQTIFALLTPSMPRPATFKIPFQSNSVWLFRNVLTNQVIFSPHRVLKSKSALKQFPSPQRRMFPLALRKDHWIPLVHVQFSTHLIANHIYKRLLDYRAWRLTSPPSQKELVMSKKHRNQLALNQVPTSIADLAHVTREIGGKMIMNWDRFEEREWAREWSENIWHCNKGFSLKRGYRIEAYQFPCIEDKVREEKGWDGSMEPPRDLNMAWQQHKTIWEKMHAKWIQKRMSSRRPKLRKSKSRLSTPS